MDQWPHFAETVTAAHLHMEAFFLLIIVLQSHINGQRASLTLGLDILS